MSEVQIHNSQELKKVQSLFDKWAEIDGYPHLSFEEYQEIFSHSELLPLSGKKVLDVGCGVGFVSSILKNMGHSVTGMDLSNEALTEAKIKNRIDKGICGDILTSELQEGDFDVVVCFSILLYIFDLKSLMEKVAKVLKPGGEFIVFDHHSRNPYVKLHFIRPNWMDLFIEGTKNVDRRPINEKLICAADQGLFQWKPPIFFSVFTRHPNWKINWVHNIARVLFSSLRKVIKRPWTGNMIFLIGKKSL